MRPDGDHPPGHRGRLTVSGAAGISGSRPGRSPGCARRSGSARHGAGLLPGARPWAAEVEVALQDERRRKVRLLDPEDAHEPGRPQGRRPPLRRELCGTARSRGRKDPGGPAGGGYRPTCQSPDPDEDMTPLDGVQGRGDWPAGDATASPRPARGQSPSMSIFKCRSEKAPPHLRPGRRRHGDAGVGKFCFPWPPSTSDTVRWRRPDACAAPSSPRSQVFQAARGRSLSPPRRRISSRWFWAERLAAWA